MIHFNKLKLSDRSAINDFTSKFPPYSDFNYVSLWSYNVQENAEFYLDEDTLIIKLPDYLTGLPIYSFLAKANAHQTLFTLFEHMQDEEHPLELNLVPESSISEDIKNDPRLHVTEDLDNFDYILSIQEVNSLQSTTMKHKRRHVAQFQSHYPMYQVKVTDCREELEKQQILNLFDKWAEDKIDRNTTYEKTALKRLLDATSEITVINVGIWNNGILIGFAILENLGEYAVGSFMKGDGEYENIYDMLYAECAKHLTKLGCAYLNYEQDLGIPGMREAKLRWHPSHFLKKYVITLNK